MSDFNKLKIKKITKETPKSVSIEFDIESTTNFSFFAGQYINVKHTVNGEELRRAYSIYSQPDSNELGIVIKAIPNGKFSNYANDFLQEGDFLEVSPPEGKFIFTPNQDAQNNYIGFCAGSGITPIYSILKTVLSKEPKSKFVLVYGNKTPRNTIFYNKILSLKEEYPDRFFVYFVYSQSPSGDFFGRIDKGIVNNVIAKKHSDLLFSKAYLCGPEKMIESVKDILKENNFTEDNILYELFFSEEEGTQINDLQGDTELSILVDGVENTFTIPKTMNILEAAIRHDLDVRYSCQGGICSSCICRVTEGDAIMKVNKILSESDIKEGLRLSCQAYAITDKISIDFDNI